MHDVTLATENGKLTALIGPNGAGKTTLLKSIVKLVKVSSGRVFMDNNEIKCSFRNRLALSIHRSLPRIAQVKLDLVQPKRQSS